MKSKYVELHVWYIFGETRNVISAKHTQHKTKKQIHQPSCALSDVNIFKASA